ncbi:MAG: hypothetical protein B7Y26_03990 [Hydrogenophilales bacterium 16-64-46]|nr:MAG: hypothetical protein B7Z32_05200 [Hydrogenophilales bacterium 12-64-13]OYZ06147.1 MAG: hypothetical protein B7Y26_03990 [Hydrogenophilales bacterium 16-64-46]OZA38954.1 MAG: hypothetical protein B7X87_05900 [Hydrogenophilales bacterium 17-64-34]HQT01033.1 hypothetical protein [Thiobacillus sp.]
MMFRLILLTAGLFAWGAQAALPDYQTFPGDGPRLLLWVNAERGRAEPELEAARKLAAQGTTVWSLDLGGAYFLPQLPSSMDAVPVQDVVDWLDAALATGKLATVYAVSRAAVPMLRAAAQLDAAQRGRLCVLLMYPNLYQSAEALVDADYLDTGRLDGLAIRLLQPRRSAATPWLPAQTAHLSALGARVTPVMLENLREGFWARETPTAFETERATQLDRLILKELESCR